MNAATGLLRREHDSQRKMLEFTKRTAEQLRRGETIEPGVLSRVVEFFRVAMGECLLAKEEEILVPALESRGLSRHDRRIALSLIDHERGRQLITEMAKASSAYDEDGRREAGEKWAGVASDFADLMLGHLKEEELMLFMMADSFLPPSEQADIAARFEKLEIAKATSERHRQIHAMPDELTWGDDGLTLAE